MVAGTIIVGGYAARKGAQFYESQKQLANESASTTSAEVSDDPFPRGSTETRRSSHSRRAAQTPDSASKKGGARVGITPLPE